VTRKNTPKRRQGAQPGNQHARKHGVYTLSKELEANGLGAIDRRSTLGRELAQKRQAIESDLGGNLSELRRDMVSRYLRMKLVAGSIDSWTC
jgi:hypothetical protein